MPTCAFVSFRLGGIDGVSKVTAIWQEIFENLGFETFTVAGEGKADFIFPELTVESITEPKKSELEKILNSADLVIVENLCTIPLNLTASLKVAEFLKGRPAIMHHHDPPWQRDEFSHITDIPIDDPNWLHITINQMAVKQMAERGISASCVYNSFKINPPTETEEKKIRERIRSLLEVEENELLVVHPTRALPRKNIPKAIEITEELGGTYWLTGNFEPFENYEKELTDLLKKANCRCIHKPLDLLTDIYIASDLVVFPSHWEGFGNPTIESAIYSRHCIVSDYPVAEELRALGFKWFRESELDELKKLLQNTEKNNSILENNFKIAKENLSMETIQAQLKELIKQLGFWIKD